MRRLIRRGRLGEPGGVVAEVEAAGAVEGFLGDAGGPVAGQERVVGVVVAGPVDRKAPGGRGAGVAQPHQGQAGAVGELAADVGELAVPADVDGGEVGPPLACGLPASGAARSWSTREAWP